MTEASHLHSCESNLNYWLIVEMFLFIMCPDHCSPGGDAEEGERAGRSQEETGSDQAAAVQVPAQRTARG